jgi:hypothetical protein
MPSLCEIESAVLSIPDQGSLMRGRSRPDLAGRTEMPLLIEIVAAAQSALQFHPKAIRAISALCRSRDCRGRSPESNVLAYQRRGWTPAQAAGIVANQVRESRLLNEKTGTVSEGRAGSLGSFKIHNLSSRRTYGSCAR